MEEKLNLNSNLQSSKKMLISPNENKNNKEIQNLKKIC